MEKRIKTVWILSIITAFTVIGIQGYWLLSQYRYAIESSAEDLFHRIIELCEEESTGRQPDDSATTIMVQKNYSYDPQNPVVNPMQIELNLDKLPGTASIDTIFLDTNMPEKVVYENALKLVANMTNPFVADSLAVYIAQSIPNSPVKIDLVTVDPEEEKESIVWEAAWQIKGSLLHPEMVIYYPYNILHRKALYITVPVLLPAILQKMAIQFFTVCLMLVIFSACLLYQIKTILKQKELSDYQKSFVNTMIHELKRPVQTLKTFVSFLRDKEMRLDEAACEEIVEDSMFELDNLSAYLEKLKDMVRADVEVSQIRSELLDIEETIHKVVRLTPIPENKQVEFDIRQEGEKMIKADPVHFANVISNLIENAIKYSGEKVRILIHGVVTSSYMQLIVTDNGIGIAPADREKIFNKFYRGGRIIRPMIFRGWG